MRGRGLKPSERPRGNPARLKPYSRVAIRSRCERNLAPPDLVKRILRRCALFSNAKVPEDSIEKLVVNIRAGDLAESGRRCSEVERDEVEGSADLQAGQRRTECLRRSPQSILVA